MYSFLTGFVNVLHFGLAIPNPCAGIASSSQSPGRLSIETDQAHQTLSLADESALHEKKLNLHMASHEKKA
ncbi:hypothetical protein [Pontibacter amylolyticus]|nr:hypothetical protein [Pontibacter amylolyticus]